MSEYTVVELIQVKVGGRLEIRLSPYSNTTVTISGNSAMRSGITENIYPSSDVITTDTWFEYLDNIVISPDGSYQITVYSLTSNEILYEGNINTTLDYNDYVDMYNFIDIAETQVISNITFSPFAFTRGAFERVIKDSLPSLRLDVSNLNPAFSSLFHAYKLEGKKIKIYHGYLEDFIASGLSAGISEEYFIKMISISDERIEVDLSSVLGFFDASFPLRYYIRDFCPWNFGDENCKFGTPEGSNTIDLTNFPSASMTECDKTYGGPNGCLAHKNTKNFGGFPQLE
ncbi:MAG: hypothetical protein ACTSRP_01985 [Candidatus Helarchaeota archaeon]